MRKIKRTKQFKRDYKRILKGRNRSAFEKEFIKVLEALSQDIPLESKYRDHAMTHNWKDHRDCHIKHDLVLIYRLPDPDTLQLVRLGSHAELGI